MRFSRLKHVVEVDRYGSITAAAGALNTTQSTVTKSVAAMEQELGFSLFQRRARGVVATEKGREFLTRASRVISDYEHLVEDSRRDKTASNALLRIGVCPTLLQGLLNHAITELIQSRSNVRVQLQAVGVERGVLLLQRGDVDLLFGPTETLSRESEFKVEPVDAIEAGLYVRKHHKLAKKKKVTRDDVRGFPIIASDYLDPYTNEILQILKEKTDQDPMRQLHILEYFPIVSRVVETTDSISFISKNYASTRAFRDKFVLLNIDIFKPLAMCCAWRTRWLPSRDARLFISYLKTSKG